MFPFLPLSKYFYKFTGVFSSFHSGCEKLKLTFYRIHFQCLSNEYRKRGKTNPAKEKCGKLKMKKKEKREEYAAKYELSG